MKCRVSRIAEMRRSRENGGEKMAARNYRKFFVVITYQRTLTTSGGYAQLAECNIIALDTEKRPLAERVIKNEY